MILVNGCIEYHTKVIRTQKSDNKQDIIVTYCTKAKSQSWNAATTAIYARNELHIADV